jgi:hypothetical protein
MQESHSINGLEVRLPGAKFLNNDRRPNSGPAPQWIRKRPNQVTGEQGIRSAKQPFAGMDQ